MSESIFIPETPAGTPLTHLEADTEQEAWDKLLEDAKHMPYNGRKGFEARGYKVYEYTSVLGDKEGDDRDDGD